MSLSTGAQSTPRMSTSLHLKLCRRPGTPAHPNSGSGAMCTVMLHARVACHSVPRLSPAITHIMVATSSVRLAAAFDPAAPAPQLVSEVQQARTPAELRAAAFLRAISFYTYPPGRSEYASRSHRHMKANEEWESLTAKVAGRDEAYRDMDVTCFIATVDDVEYPDSGGIGAAGGYYSTTDVQVLGTGESSSGTQGPNEKELLYALRSCLDQCAQLPAEPGAAVASTDARVSRPPGPVLPRPRPRRLVIGSLDLNVGHTLPSEELIGRNPQADPRRRRAYLSNVCVAPAARRLGIASALLRHAEDVARGSGVEWLYVHVVADNTPAVGLYCNTFGFQVEQSESEGFARSLQRPRRLLLAKCLGSEAQLWRGA
ncbi:hypothetical protein VaNZ11_001757 [Volvox africanus]|uniref:N-acetyltransferase domain-containing protein n=1 Tax=Volvox africanus TaxID=51714 RepID=A0ABQ5RQE2_9CHLO|nr:hypothetical protein VaNZ11_001757 [Volvox africanus]